MYLVRARFDGTVTLERRKGEDGATIFVMAAPSGRRSLAFLPAVGDILRNPGDLVTAGPASAVALFSGAEDALRAYTIMGQAADTSAVSPRDLQIVAVVDNDLWAADEDGTATLIASAAFFDTELWSDTLYGKTFIGGAGGYKVYDHEFRTLRSFEGSTKGKFPERCRLGVNWRGRLWLAAGDKPFEWYMARLGDPFDMDFQPAVLDEAMPVSSITSHIGAIPDVVRCLMPWSSDIAYVGCGSSTWRIEGDPATDGRLVFVADVGVAFGQGSYCKDTNGNLYFFAAHGDICIVRVGSGVPVSLSDTRIGARLRDVDLRVYRPKLVWNTSEKTLHVLMLPRMGLRADVLHFVWQSEFDAWHVDSFVGGPGRCVMSATKFDADDPGDRMVVLGFADGSLRKFHRYAEDDDGLVRPWSVTAGPIHDPNLATSLRMASLHVTTAGRGRYKVLPWGTDEPSPQRTPRGHEHSMVGGQTGGISPEAAGAYLYATIFGTEDVTLQGIVAGVVPAGRVRNA